MGGGWGFNVMSYFEFEGPCRIFEVVTRGRVGTPD